MGSKALKTATAGLAAFALAASPAAAMPAKDYSRNGATGDYAPQQHMAKNYGLNGASGDFAAQIPSSTPVAPVAPPQTHQATAGSFAWGAALAGAGTTLLLVLALGGTLRMRRRTSGAPRIA